MSEDVRECIKHSSVEAVAERRSVRAGLGELLFSEHALALGRGSAVGKLEVGSLAAEGVLRGSQARVAPCLAVAARLDARGSHSVGLLMTEDRTWCQHCREVRMYRAQPSTHLVILAVDNGGRLDQVLSVDGGMCAPRQELVASLGRLDRLGIVLED